MRTRHAITVFALLLRSIASFSQNQTPSSTSTPPPANPTDPDRIKGMEYYQQHRLAEAVPLLFGVISRYPNDVVAHERLGVSLIGKSDTDVAPAQAKADLIEARAQLPKAKSLGDNSNLLQTLLEMIPENGERAAFSGKTGADSAMRRGEAAFAQGKFDDALREYEAAYEVDPTLYVAALDMGDIYFRLKQTDKAGEWFSRAIEINPNEEAAYRYWGDALLQAGNYKEARSKYIEGLASFPYRSASWNGIKNWLALNHLSFNPLAVAVPASVTSSSKNSININLDPSTMGKDDGGATWFMYGAERALWRQEKFAKEFPGEKEYRHSLKEEVDALSLTVTSYKEQKKSGQVKHPADGLELLSRVQADNMLEPYVLLLRADKDIARDFPDYQSTHKDCIYRQISSPTCTRNRSETDKN
ncbi:MAG TPA: tetratricopeptide repeat protein [Terriglobales bacterium]|nr:tetratricopeptide repeat protein [Terriglobales bacterium]